MLDNMTVNKEIIVRARRIIDNLYVQPDIMQLGQQCIKFAFTFENGKCMWSYLSENKIECFCAGDDEHVHPVTVYTDAEFIKLFLEISRK